MTKDKKEESGEAKILPHNYDGIQELDNPLPGWWLFTFYITIVFAVGYYGYYEFFDGPSSDQYLSQSMEIINAKKEVEFKKAESQPQLGFAELKSDEKMMAAGKAHYTSLCAACHGQAGEGIIGPNLTDNFWMHSKGDVQGILTAIQKGFLEKGMPPWKELIPIKEQPYLAAYVKTLQGTSPKNPKAPQGDEVQ